MHRTTKLKVTDINQHLVCILCDGYLIDATTIVECLHSFCRTCIVRYLENSRYCPVCDVQVHKTKPLQSIRSDTTLQDIVYKLIPGLYPNEMQRRREFYSEHPEAAAKCSTEERGEGAEQRCFYSPKENISLTLEYFPGSDAQDESISEDSDNKLTKDFFTRHLFCPAALPVANLKKFIRMKFSVPNSYTIKILYSDTLLSDDYTLMDIAYIFSWRRAGPMKFLYTFYHDSTVRHSLPLPEPTTTTCEKVPEPLSVPPAVDPVPVLPDPPVIENGQPPDSASVTPPPPITVECDKMDTEPPPPEAAAPAAEATPEPMEVQQPPPEAPPKPKVVANLVPKSTVVASPNGLKLKLIHCAAAVDKRKKGGRSRYKSAPVQNRFPRLAPYPPPPQQLKIAPMVSPGGGIVTAIVSNSVTTPIVTATAFARHQAVAPAGYMRGLAPRVIMPSAVVNGQGSPMPTTTFVPAAGVNTAPSPVNVLANGPSRPPSAAPTVNNTPASCPPSSAVPICTVNNAVSAPTSFGAGSNTVTTVCPNKMFEGIMMATVGSHLSNSSVVATTVSPPVSSNCAVTFAVTTVCPPVQNGSDAATTVSPSVSNGSVNNSVVTTVSSLQVLNGGVSASSASPPVSSATTTSTAVSRPPSANSSTVSTNVMVSCTPSVVPVATSQPIVVPTVTSTGAPSAVFGRASVNSSSSSSSAMSTVTPSAVFGRLLSGPIAVQNGCEGKSETTTTKPESAKSAAAAVNGGGGEMNREAFEQKVKDSISAEFSDSEDLQPELVVDERSKDSSDEEALREKIAAIAGGEEEDADSGRASDLTRSDEDSDRAAKSNHIHTLISNLHRNNHRKDPSGALDLSSGKRPAGGPRPKAVANPVLDTKHRQQTYLPAPTKPHTACAPAPPKPPSAGASPILLNALHHKAPHLPVQHFPAFAPSSQRRPSPSAVNLLPNFMLGQAQFPLQPTSNHMKGVTPSPQNPYGKLSLATHLNKQSPTNRKPEKATLNRTMSYTPGAQALYPKSSLAALNKLSPHHRSASPAPSPLSSPSSAPSPKSSSSPSSSVVPMYNKKTSNSYRSYSAPYKYKGGNFSVINPDPSGNLQKLVIRNNDVSRPSKSS